MNDYIIPVHLNVKAEDPFAAQRLAESLDGSVIGDGSLEGEPHISLMATQIPSVDEEDLV